MPIPAIAIATTTMRSCEVAQTPVKLLQRAGGFVAGGKGCAHRARDRVDLAADDGDRGHRVGSAASGGLDRVELALENRALPVERLHLERRVGRVEIQVDVEAQNLPLDVGEARDERRCGAG